MPLHSRTDSMRSFACNGTVTKIAQIVLWLMLGLELGFSYSALIHTPTSRVSTLKPHAMTRVWSLKSIALHSISHHYIPYRPLISIRWQILALLLDAHHYPHRAYSANDISRAKITQTTRSQTLALSHCPTAT